MQANSARTTSELAACRTVAQVQTTPNFFLQWNGSSKSFDQIKNALDGGKCTSVGFSASIVPCPESSP